jgi:NADPH:quinone reductase-like Zn-dependent oxidoreductase/malonyl CoA-acyl carrier protein transacylase/NADP-dependent 3-hydroxy acid dehydrogenase YdfG/acyl carrier protein
MGEVAAAHVAGVLSLEDAVAIICRRSRLLRRISGQGAMALVELPVVEAESTLVGYEDRLSVAVSNSPRFTVLSGDPSALAEVLALLESRGVFCRRVNVDVASHSPQVDPLREELIAALAALKPGAALIPMRSTVTGAMVSGAELSAEYWADNVRQPVRFAQSVQSLIDDGHLVFVEMSPHPILLPSVQEILGTAARDGVAVGSLRRKQDERQTLLESLGTLWVHGYRVAWARQFPAGGRKVQLPTYPWQRERYWIEGARGAAKTLVGPAMFYNAETRVYQGKILQNGSNVPEAYLTFGLFPEIVPGFSWLRTHAEPEKHQDHAQLGLMAQRDLRTLLFRWVDFSSCKSALDFGCGYSTDVLFLAKKHAHLALDGYTISSEQAQIGAQRVREARVDERVKIYNKDSAVDAFPGRYDLVFGFEVAHHIRDKQGLFSNVGSHLRDGGLLVLADFISNTQFEIEHNETSSFVITKDQWVEVLSKNKLRATHCVDVSHEIANFLYDPNFASNMGLFAALYGNDENIAPTFSTYHEFVQLLRRGLVSYVVLTVQKDEQASDADLEKLNRGAFDGLTPYAALASSTRTEVGGRNRHEENDEHFLELDWELATVPASRVTAGRWLLLGGAAGVGANLAEALGAAGHAVFHAADASLRAPALRALLTEAFGGQAPTAVVHLGSLDEDPGARPSSMEWTLQHGCDSVLCAVQVLAGIGYRNPPRLWLLTRGAQALHGGDVSTAQSPMLGLGRVVAMEHAELRCARIDLDPARPDEEVNSLLEELLADDAEEETAWRSGARHVARLVHRAPRAARSEHTESAADRPFRLELDEMGSLKHLVLRASERRAPMAGEVEIAVEAAGVSFRDVLGALGVMPEDPAAETQMAFGQECAGRVVSVGEGVTELAVGQSVVALALGAFSSHLTTSAGLVVPRPEGLTSTEAAALPVAQVTAWWALESVARLQPGERVLIHGAADDVGLAAIQWAKHVGAQVFATAGTPERRAYLASIGVEHVSDSHSDRFVGDVLGWTGGEGVDVVVNPLSDDAMSGLFVGKKSFGLLRAKGRFVELGEREYSGKDAFDADQPLGTASFLRVDLRAMQREEPAALRAALERVLGLIATGVLMPPVIDSFPASRATEVFERMAKSRYTGKLVMTWNDAETPIRVPDDAASTIHADGSYLVTGGLGGLGLSVAGWLADRGAGHLVLAGRSGVVTVAQKEAVASLSARGTRVTIAKVDIADRAQVENVIAEISASGMPLRGIIHAAGILDDGFILQQSPERFRRVMAPKVEGALHLHELTKGAPLDFFVMYSSAAGLFGSPGQASYAAANAFLDALAHARRAQGLPGLSIDWGPFSEVGLAVAQENRGARMVSRGMRNLSPAEGLSALIRLLDSQRVQTGVLSLDVRQWLEFYPAAASSRTLSRLVSAERAGAGRPTVDAEVMRRIAAAEPGEKVGIIEEIIAKQVSQVLRIAEGKVDLKAPLTSLGMDSLMGLELRNRIEIVLGLMMPATLLWTYPTVATLSRHLLGEMTCGVDDEQPQLSPNPENSRPEESDLTELDQDGVLALLDAALAHEKGRSA